ncbi:hypothetical protein PILCRDRAFT_7118 [Piloderma croceum F 1598]|uniref:Uncharacterized protein n=1 Tax=Piloderma croceum (strain F 1598) TaxID=765440 RepID=A0A0C3FH82_PILCF|nr:hypothetical protein PILCRDRAFT_7118 [Piloderma croceum F 1598]
MKIHWNTTLAEISRGIELKPALNQWVDTMEQHLTGKAKATARHCQKKWDLSREEWEMLEKLCTVLEKYQEATLKFSTTTAPTICKVLPIYKAIQEHLKNILEDPNLANMQNAKYTKLKNAVREGLEKMDIYLAKALKGDYPLLGTILHPSIQLFLLEHLFEVYHKETAPSSTSASTPNLSNKMSSMFLAAIQSMTPSQQDAALTSYRAQEILQWELLLS